MKKFLTEFGKYYWRLGLLGALLIVVSVGITWKISSTRMEQQHQLDETIRELDEIYASHQNDEAKKDAIIRSQDDERWHTFWREFFSRMAEALFLAGVMILTAEGVTKFIAARDEEIHMQNVIGEAEARATTQANTFDTRYNKLVDSFESRYTELSQDFDRRIQNISSNVWQAMVKKMVPDKIGTEILAILKSDVCRFRPIYAVTLLREPFSDLQDDEIVVRRELSYEISNLTGSAMTYPLRIEVLSHTGGRSLGHSGRQVTLPRICEVKMDDVDVPLNGAHLFEKPVSLSADPNVVTKIQSVVEEIAKVNDRALYVLREPCVGVELHIDNQIPHLVTLLQDQVYLTSGTKRLKRNIGMVWSYDHAVLSGTALSVAWEPKRKALPPPIPTGLEDVEIV